MKNVQKQIAKKNHWYTDDQIKNQLQNPSYNYVVKLRLSIFKKIIIQKVMNTIGQITFLDAGVGDGVNLFGINKILKETENNYKIYACDYNEVRIQRAKKFKFVKDFRVLNLTKTSYSKNMFDIILCNHVLEHIIDTDKAVKELKRILKPNGILIFNVPNEGCLMAILRNNILQKEISNTTDHVHFFTKKSLSEIFNKNKLKIINFYRLGFFFPFLPIQIFVRKFFIGRLAEKFLGKIFRSQSTDLIAITTKT